MKRVQYATGVTGEAIAEEYLCAAGMQCIARRWRGADGEIDLVMEDGEALVFVEVKYRPTAQPGMGLIAVHAKKQQRMLHAATAFLAERQSFDRSVRFDVVEISAAGICHVRDAFRAG